MKTVLVIIGIIVIGPFFVGFIWASLSGMFGRKRERAQAQIFLSQVPKGAFGLLLMVLAAFKLQDVAEANRRTQAYPSETQALLESLGRARDPKLSAGGIGDRLNLTVWKKELLERGYSEDAAAIIAYVHHHHLEELLNEVIQTRR